MSSYKPYYVPEKTYLPILGSIALTTLVLGIVNTLRGNFYGVMILGLGSILLAIMMFGWFKNVIDESLAGLYNAQMGRSFRLGMIWFIFSEVMFFVAFFGALFYARVLSVPWLGGAYNNEMTNAVLWPNFQAIWPLLTNPDNVNFVGPKAVIEWHLPALNTALLLTSGVTLTVAHHALKENQQNKLLVGLFLTVLLGTIFLFVQGYEYKHAYDDLGLTLSSGIYGSTFFLLTGFHGFHVTIGAIMLLVILIRSYKGHFTKEKHFAFEAVAWYWHFVDVVWLLLFIFVYIL